MGKFGTPHVGGRRGLVVMMAAHFDAPLAERGALHGLGPAAQNVMRTQPEAHCGKEGRVAEGQDWGPFGSGKGTGRQSRRTGC